MVIALRTFVDTHLHYYSVYDPDLWLDALSENLRRASQERTPTDYAACLLDTDGHEFDALKNRRVIFKRWWLRPAECDSDALVATNDLHHTVYLLRGQQWATGEGLELAVTGPALDLSHHLSLEEYLSRCTRDHLAVLPWGAGKWWGRRGRVVCEALSRHRDGIFAGDNGGRPSWFRSRLLENPAIRTLAGTDPLPFASDANRVGSYASVLPGKLDASQPCRSFIELVNAASPPIFAVGQRISLSKFIISQSRLRM